MDTIWKKRNKTAEKTKKRSVLSPEGKNQVGDEKEQSACCRTVPRSSTISLNDSERENAEGKSRKAMTRSKGGSPSVSAIPTNCTNHSW
ncbi:hypothetical protein MTR67_001582 [Solanum verrucosum]|uniref:Uncharacterized protein n=1 Tax=Solanum verrucosum TaxID=315347 RepID=A0AAF0T556_SOLVR|nr:hypothetical protein MTR67_001582 [Solanum verrucosum]